MGDRAPILKLAISSVYVIPFADALRAPVVGPLANNAAKS